ncbi:hypothetical protein V2A60_005287 [Cordyceps javanica]|uniref:Acyltransferase invovled in MEL production n=1 Tax=Cordyceps javanica TaxID=43265 RepID=A0A545VDQ5_9HYPO|nr:Acyltransferase invovled in MEL production [Cordyceps javanica]TQW10470.1 Acyltransferase invovled in MEL production [Cordyceps javanica]
MSVARETETTHHWRETIAGTWTRPCLGEEQTASYIQNIRDGHTELTIEVPFTCNVTSVTELTLRARNAWLACHSRFPQGATEISTGTELPQLLTYPMLRSEDDAATWLQDTFVVVADQSSRDVAKHTYSRRLTTKGKRSMLYLVIDPSAKGRHALVWNVSHVVSDAFSIPIFMNEILDQMTKVPGDVLLAVKDIDYSHVVDRLPIHPSVLYEARYRPNEEQREQAIADILAQDDLYASHIEKSIKMYPRSDNESREHETHCVDLQFSLEQSQNLLAELRREKLSITYAAAAATLLAVNSMYGQGQEKGALLGMTRNARRWVETDKACASASSAIFLWIPFEKQWLQGSTRDSVLTIGRVIREQLQPYLTGPHHLSLPSLSFASQRAINGLAATNGVDLPASPCPPGFSPQGAVNLKRTFDSDGVHIDTHDLRHTGRQINESPWVGMFSLWDRLSLSLGFDSKYHDPAKMSRLIADVQHNLGSVAPASAKL